MFKAGDKIIVVRNKKERAYEKDYSSRGEIKYPIIGWTGTISGVFHNNVSREGNSVYTINWTIKPKPSGDLIYGWMIKKVEDIVSKSIFTKPIKHNFKKGDWIRNKELKTIGKVRHIGIISGEGISRTTIWSDWGMGWDGKLRSASVCGTLVGEYPTNLELLTESERIRQVNKTYRFYLEEYY